jgi:hypothetical protein
VHVTDVNALINSGLVHEVHTSERRSYRGCRRRWHWVFQEFYYPQTTAKPLEFGVAFHEAMEVLYDPSTWALSKHVAGRDMLLLSAQTRFVDTCEKQRKKFGEVNPNGMTDEARVDYDERVLLGKGMLNYYWHDVAPEWDSHFTPEKVEVSFMVPIQDPDTKEYLFCHCNRCWKTYCAYIDAHEEQQYIDHAAEGALPWIPLEQQEGERDIWTREHPGLLVCLAGRLDMLVRDKHGHYWIVDWKTAARLARGDASGQDRDEFLELDDQIGSYVMALRRKLGLNVRGFIYVELKKGFPQPPTENKVVRLGCKFSKNKNQDVDYVTYLKTVQEYDKDAYEAGLYDDMLTFLKEGGANFYGRYQIVKTDEELEEIERTLFMEAAEMTDSKTRIYPSPGRFSCGFCAFRQPCLEKFRQGDFQYMLDTLYEKREKHYWVKELSTDKQGGE